MKKPSLLHNRGAARPVPVRATVAVVWRRAARDLFAVRAFAWASAAAGVRAA